MGPTKAGTSRSYSTWWLDILCLGKRRAKSTTQQPSPPRSLPTCSEQSFPRFFDLPRELRDRVYEICLFTPLPTRSISHSEAMRRHTPIKSTLSYNCVKYSPDLSHLTGSTLLLCSRQINAEVKDAMSRLKTHVGLHYILDCELIGERYIYPTWLLLPVLARHVPFVYVDLRSTGVAYPSSYTGWIGNGGPGRMIWGLFDILQTFSFHGPHFTPQSSQQQNAFIDTLLLDVLSCGNNADDDNGAINSEEPAAQPLKLEEWFRSESPMSGRMVDSADSAIDGLLYFMNRLFVDAKDSTPHAKDVAKAVRKIYLLHDGVEVYTWDTQSYKHLQ